jgi:hypothetical protein
VVTAAQAQPDRLATLAAACEQLEQFDHLIEVPDMLFQLGASFGLAPLQPLHIGVHRGRQAMDAGKAILDVEKGKRSRAGIDHEGRPLLFDPLRQRVDTVRHLIWFAGHTLGLVNWLHEVGVFRFGAAEPVMAQLIPGVVLAGFTANIAVSLVDLSRCQRRIREIELALSQEADAATSQALMGELNQCETKMHHSLLEIVKNIFAWLGVFAATILARRFSREVKISRRAVCALQLTCALIGAYQVFHPNKHSAGPAHAR